jgi:hypothetical protein
LNVPPVVRAGEEKGERMSKMLLEELESRMLMSATTAAVLSPAVLADRVVINQDLIKLKVDSLSFASVALGDLAAIKGDSPKSATTVLGAVKTMRTDLATMRLELASDRLAEAAAVVADRAVILSDLKMIAKDKGNPTAKAADLQKLTADRTQLVADLTAMQGV